LNVNIIVFRNFADLRMDKLRFTLFWYVTQRRSVVRNRRFETRQHIGPIFKCQAVQEDKFLPKRR